jgi:hypothetical protein
MNFKLKSAEPSNLLWLLTHPNDKKYNLFPTLNIRPKELYQMLQTHIRGLLM